MSFKKTLSALVVTMMSVSVFAAATATLTMESTTGGKGQIQISGTWEDEGAKTIDTGAAYNIQTVVDTGYKFVRWKITDNDVETTIADVTASSTTVTVATDASKTEQSAKIEAVFATDTTYALTINTNTQNPLSLGTIGYVSTASDYFRIPATKNVVVGDMIKVSGSTGNDGDYTVTSVYSSSTYTYVYVANVPDATADGTLSVYSATIATGGGTKGVVGAHTLAANTRYDINAKKLDGYSFDGWAVTGGATVKCSTALETYVVVTADGTLEPKYTAVTQTALTMNVSPDTNTQYDILNTTGAYFDVFGDQVSNFTVGDKFIVTGSSNNDGVYTVALVARDGENTRITTSQTPQDSPTAGKIQVNAAGYAYQDGATWDYVSTNVNKNEWVDIAAVSKTGYRFVSWAVTAGSGVILDSADPTTQVVVNGDDATTVQATFETSSTATLTVAIDPSDKGTSEVGDITGVSTNNKSFQLAGNKTGFFKNWSTNQGDGTQVTVSGSTGNDGTYIVDRVTVGATYIGAVTGVDTTNKQFTVAGDQTATLKKDVVIRVRFSTGNDGFYTLASDATYDGTTSTTITVTETIPSAVVDGSIYTIDSTTVFVYQTVSDGTANGKLNVNNVGSASYASSPGVLSPTSGTINTGQWYDLNAEPSPGYSFVKWAVTSGDAVLDFDDLPFASIVILGDATATAYFSPDYKLTMATTDTDSDGATGTTDPTVAGSPHTVVGGQMVEIEATPGAGCEFVKWSATENGTLTSTTAPKTFVTLAGDTTVTAQFKKSATATTAVLTVDVNPVDAGTVTEYTCGVHTLNANQWYDVTASALAGYSFVKWTTADGATVMDILDKSSKVFLASNGSITAEFQKDAEDAKVCLTLAADPVYAGDEVAMGGWGTYTVNQYQWYNIDADPKTGFRFTKWSVTSGTASILDVYDDSTTVCVSADATVTATFAQDATAVTQYTLTVGMTPDAGGATDPFLQELVDGGVLYDLEAYPADGYVFSSWSATSGATVYGVNCPNAYVSLSADAVVTANFTKLDLVSLTLATSPEAGGNSQFNDGSTKPEGIYTVPKGTWLYVETTAVDGYKFLGWTVSGGATILDYNSTVSSVYLTADGTVTANYEFDYTPNTPVTLTLAADPQCGAGSLSYTESGMTVNGPGSFYVHSGSQFSVATSAKTGYRFLGWKVTSGTAWLQNCMAANTNCLLTGDATLTAQFEQVPTAALTIAISPDVGGDEWEFGAGTYQVNTSTWYDIDAEPGTGYTFSNWSVTSGSATIRDVYSNDTEVCVTGDAAITANFTAGTMAQLTMAVNTEGTGTTDPEVGASEKTVGVWYGIEATPAAGYAFTGWSVTENATLGEYPEVNPSSVMLSGDATVTANFAAATTATLTLAASPEAGGSAGVSSNSVWVTNKKTTLNTGRWYDINATATTGYSFSHWTVSGSATVLDVNESWTAAYLTGDATLTANFNANSTSQATLTLAADPACGVDWISLDGSATYLGAHVVNTGTWYKLGIESKIDWWYTEGIGYLFSSWSVTSGDATIRYCEDAEAYYVYLTGDATVTANLTQVSTATLTVDVTPDNSGIVEDYAEGAHVVPKDKWLAVYAYPAAGYKYKNMTLTDASSSRADSSILNDLGPHGCDGYGHLYLVGDALLTVNFEAATTATLTMAVTPDGAGQTTYEPGTHTIVTGERMYAYAYPATGYKFTGWGIAGSGTLYYDECDSGIGNLVYFILTGDATLTAQFESTTTAQVTMAVSPAGAGYCYPAAGTYTYNVGQKYSISAYPECGYQFSQWTASGATVDETGESSTFMTVTGDGTVTAEFIPVPTSQLTLAADPLEGLGGYNDEMFMDSGYFYFSRDFDICECEPYWESLTPGAYTVLTNKKYLIKVYPYDTYNFTGWSYDSTLAQVQEVTDYGCWGSCYEESSCFCSQEVKWYYVTLYGDATVTAQFEKKSTAVLTWDIQESGGGVVGMYDCDWWEYYDVPITQTVYVGDKYKVKAYTADGYYFWGWKLTSGAADISYDFTEDCFSEAIVTPNDDATVQAIFKTTEPVIPVLTMTTTNTFEYTALTPDVGKYNVQYDTPYAISATAASGYYFVRWDLTATSTTSTRADSDVGYFGSSVSASTTVTLLADATVTPIFGHVVEDGLTITNMSIRTDSETGSLKGSAKVSKALMTDIPDLSDISDGVIFGFDGWETTFTSWTKEPASAEDRSQVYEYQSDDRTFKFKLDKNSGVLDVTISKSDLFSLITPSNGIDVYIIIGTSKWEKTVTVSENSNWSYRPADKSTADITTFSANYTMANGKTENKDKVSVVGQSLTSVTGMSASTVVSVILKGGAEFKFDPADTENVTVKSKGGKYTYTYKSADKSVKLSMKLSLDFDNQKWSIRVANSDQGSKLPRTISVDVPMVITLKYVDADGNTLASEGFSIPSSETDNPVVVKSSMTYKQ